VSTESPRIDELRLRLQRARVRLQSATHGSPEWDAASTAIDDIETAIRRTRRVSCRAKRRTADA
jgi:hypothetical protein